MKKRKFKPQETLSVEEFKQRYASPLVEEELQRSIMDYCMARRWLCLQTSHRQLQFPCPSCNSLVRSPRGYGANKGVPDLLIRKGDWPAWMWLGMECKGRNTKVSPEQSSLEVLGAIVIVRTLDDAIRILDGFCFPPHPPS